MGKLLKANELRREVALNFSIQNVPDKRLTVLSIARQADFFENRKKSTFKTQTSPKPTDPAKPPTARAKPAFERNKEDLEDRQLGKGRRKGNPILSTNR